MDSQSIRVLLVDDNAMVRKGIRILLKQSEGVHVIGEAALAPYVARFRVVTAMSGEDALELIGRLPVDLVITDVRMPGMDGVELVRQLSSRHPRLPVIVMTAFSSARLLRELASCSPGAVLEKPLELEELVRVVEQCLLESPEGVLVANGNRRKDRRNDPEV